MSDPQVNHAAVASAAVPSAPPVDVDPGADLEADLAAEVAPEAAVDAGASIGIDVGVDVGADVEAEVAVAPLLARLADRLGASASARTVYGDPVTTEGVTVIPVARALWTLGGGGGRDRHAARSGEGLGIGGVAHARAVGFIEIRDGKAAFVPIHDQRSETWYGLAAVVAALTAPRLVRALRRR